MSDRDSCTHHFEHVKQTRPFTEREYMQCTKCGHQNPLGLFQHWDAERDGPAFKWPPRIDFARNSYAYQYDPKIMPKKTWLDHMINAFKDAFTAPFKPKREPYIKIRRKEEETNWHDGQDWYWQWECHRCENTGGQSWRWKDVIEDGHTHAIMKHALPEHAHNHHGDER